MAADPKDTTVTEETTDTASEAVAAPAKKLSPEQLIRAFEHEQQKSDLPDIYVGDTVRVGVRISEGNKERVQPYEGVVISKRHGGLNETHYRPPHFPRHRRVNAVFMLTALRWLPSKVDRRGKVRRAKLSICCTVAGHRVERSASIAEVSTRSIQSPTLDVGQGVHRLAPLVPLVERRSPKPDVGVRVLHGASDDPLSAVSGS